MAWYKPYTNGQYHPVYSLNNRVFSLLISLPGQTFKKPDGIYNLLLGTCNKLARIMVQCKLTHSPQTSGKRFFFTRSIFRLVCCVCYIMVAGSNIPTSSSMNFQQQENESAGKTCPSLHRVFPPRLIKGE